MSQFTRGRRRLGPVIVLAVLLAACAALLTAQRSVDDATAHAAASSASSAADIAGEIDRSIQGAEARVTSELAGTGFTSGMLDDPSTCTITAGGSAAFGDPQIHIIDLDGHLRCSSFVPEDGAASSDYAGSDWLVPLRAAAVNEPLRVAPLADPVTQRPVVVLVASLLDDGRHAAVSTVDVSLIARDLDARFAETALAPYFTIIDAGHRYMYARSAPGGGGPTTGTDFSRQLTDGANVFLDFDGSTRIWGEATIDVLGWHLFSGVLEHEALADSRRRMLLTEIGAGASVLAAALVALFLRRRRTSPAPDSGTDADISYLHERARRSA